MRPMGGFGPVGHIKPYMPKDLAKYGKFIQNQPMRYIRKVYRRSWLLLGTWSQNPERVP